MARLRKYFWFVFLVCMILVGTFVVYCIVCFYIGYRELALLSAVKVPVRQALERISEDMERGRHEHAYKKLISFQNQWRDFEYQRGINYSLSNLLYSFYLIDEDMGKK